MTEHRPRFDCFAMTSLNLVVLYVADLERSRRFYEAIGLTFVQERHRNGPVHFACQTGDMVFELYSRRVGDKNHASSAPVTLGFQVSSLAAALEGLRSAGISGASLNADRSAQLVRLVDPDGHAVFLTASHTQSQEGTIESG
jgi:catechol 2,3-dioxygenase-like lactoylglutathione lyase family enzyme